jgi:uncharacterized protein (TIGR03083 family)
VKEVDWPALRHEVVDSTGRVGDLLRSAPDPAAVVPPLTWTVAEVGAHLLSLPRRYRAQMEAPTPFPGSMSAFNGAANDAVELRDTGALADALEAEMGAFMDLLGDDPGAPTPFYGMMHSVEGLAGIALGELLVHGLDLARLLGQPWPITPEQALAAIAGTLPTLPNFTDASVAASGAGTYHLHPRGGDDWTVRVAEGGATVSRGRPERADLHVSFDPVAYMLVGYQRRSQWRALLGGQIVAWGRKPWLGLRFGKLFAEN